MNDLASATELAAMLNVTRATLYRYLARPEFPAPAVAHLHHRLWDRKAVTEWAARTLPLPEGRPPKHEKEVWS